MKNKFLTFKTTMPIVAAALIFSGCGKKSNDPTPIIDPPTTTTVPPVTPTPPTTPVVTYNYAALSDSLQTATYTTFLSGNSKYFVKNNTGSADFNYWPNAHMLDVLTDGFQRNKSTDLFLKMKALLTGIKTANGNTYSNEYYDDMGWLANASLRGYLLTNDADYLSVAEQLYNEIKTGYNNTMGGGIAWRKGQLYYKNMPTTGNMCIMAARHYKLQNNADDLTLAKNLYDWMKAKLVLSSGEVLDGINRNNDGQVDNWVFTYNQGLFIGSAVELYNITKNRAYLVDAILTANNSLTDSNLLSNGVWKSEGQGDGGLFKGVLARYLTLLADLPDLDDTNRALYTAFLQKTARTLYFKGIARPSLMISPDWTLQPAASTDLTTQLSGVIMIEAAAKLKKAGRIE